MKKFLFRFPLIMIGLIGSISYASTRQEAVSLFFDGNRAYKQGDFKAAIESYEGIVQKGEASGAVYFNLGNSYFKDNQLGKSIVNYERALKIIPRDSDLKYNLKYAMSFLPQREEAGERNLIARLLAAHRHFYSTDEMILVILVLIFWAGVFYLAGLWVKWSKAMMRMGLFFIAFLIFIFVWQLNVKLADEKNAAVILKTTDAKFEPRAEATIHFSLHDGNRVTVIKEEGNWVKIKRPDGKLGWVEAANLEGI